MLKFIKKNIRYFLLYVYNFQKKNTGLYVSSNFRSVLVSATAGIGDAIMVLPLIKQLRHLMPDCRIDVVANPTTQNVFAFNKYINSVLILSKNPLKYIRLVMDARKKRYQVFLGTIPSNTISILLLPYFSNIYFRIKHELIPIPIDIERDYGFLYNQLLHIPQERHRVLCNLDLLKVCGLKPNYRDSYPKLEIDRILIKRDFSFKDKYNLQAKRYIAIHAGCNKSRTRKMWSWRKFVSLVDFFCIEMKVRVILVGGDDDIEVSDNIATSAKASIVSFVARCSLIETAIILSNCLLAITNDSGLMHVAAAVDAPVVAIFGPTDHKHIGPCTPKSCVVKRDSDVDSVTVADVINASVALVPSLSGSPS